MTRRAFWSRFQGRFSFALWQQVIAMATTVNIACLLCHPLRLQENLYNSYKMNAVIHSRGFSAAAAAQRTWLGD